VNGAVVAMRPRISRFNDSADDTISPRGPFRDRISNHLGLVGSLYVANEMPRPRDVAIVQYDAALLLNEILYSVES
jgi:hypothetical protein